MYTHSLQDIKDKCLNDIWSLWCMVDNDKLYGVAITMVETFPQCKVFRILYAGGNEMDKWFDFCLNELDNIARINGCKYVALQGRKGWEKKTKYNLEGYRLFKEVEA